MIAIATVRTSMVYGQFSEFQDVFTVQMRNGDTITIGTNGLEIKIEELNEMIYQISFFL